MGFGVGPPLTAAERAKRANAYRLVSRALRRGELIRPSICSRCHGEGGRWKIHAHHEDYDRPLEVRWLCQPCHFARHYEIEKERFAPRRIERVLDQLEQEVVA